MLRKTNKDYDLYQKSDFQCDTSSGDTPAKGLNMES